MNIDRDVRVQNPVEIKGANGISVNFIPSRAIAISTPAIGTVYPRGILFVGTGGDVYVRPSDQGQADSQGGTKDYILFKNITSGSFLPIYINGIGAVANGTTATDLVLCTI
jgi:hypothetical protein